MATPGMSNTCEKYPTTAKSTEFVVQVSDATIMDGRSKSRAHNGMTTAAGGGCHDVGCRDGVSVLEEGRNVRRRRYLLPIQESIIRKGRII